MHGSLVFLQVNLIMLSWTLMGSEQQSACLSVPRPSSLATGKHCNMCRCFLTNLYPSLENDLRALRLLHDQVIDTVIVFPHDKGAPYRRALRDMYVVCT